MKIPVIGSGNLGGGFCLVLALLLWPHPAAPQPTPDRMLGKMDSDGDGKISRGEYRGRRRPFKSFDRDGDGFITRPEIEAVFGGGRRGKRGKRKSRRARGTPAPTGPMLNGQVGMDALDEETLCGIGRGYGCDIKIAIKRGLFETGLEPAFPEGLACRGIDEAWAIDYTYKRDRENYHGGIDMPAPFGTPMIAAADGTVVARYDKGNSFRGREIILRHSPEDTGLPVWIYTQYGHFDEMPKHKIGQRVKMGEVFGPTGNSGGRPRQSRRERRPAIHFAAWFSADPRYVSTGRKIVPVGGYWMDPNALYRKGPPFNSRSLKALPEGEKQAPISVMTQDGKVHPPGAKIVWPYFCERE
jgi:hypothetical protein